MIDYATSTTNVQTNGSSSKSSLLIVGRRSYSDLLADRLERIGAFSVIGFCESLDAARQMRDLAPPDLLLADPGVSSGSAFDSMLELVGEREHGPIAVLTSRWSKLTLKLALEGGLCGFLLTDDPLDDLLDKLNRICQGEQCFSRRIEQELTRNRGRWRIRRPSQLTILNENELYVLRKLAQGDSIKEIAAELDKTYKAIDSVKFRMMQKLDIHNRIDLVRLAIREGLAVA